jgi:uncharacterized membrane protein
MPETPPLLLANDAVLFGVLALILGLVFWTSESGHPFRKRFYAIFPPLLLAYFLPALLTTFGLVDPEQSQLYFVASRYLMPAALVLLTAVADLPGTLKLGPKALIMFFTGTLSVMAGGALAIYIAALIAPDVIAAEGPDAVWRGTSTVAGSWIGGSPNQTALREIFGAGADTFAIWVAVDVLVASVWLAMMLWVAANQQMVDRWLKADVTSLDAVKRRAHDYETQHARIPSLGELIAIIAVGFGATGLAHYAADWLTPYFQTNFPDAAQFSVHSSFFWLIVVATILGVLLSFTPVRKLQGAGASRVGSLFVRLRQSAAGAQHHALAVAPDLNGRRIQGPAQPHLRFGEACGGRGCASCARRSQGQGPVRTWAGETEKNPCVL